MHLVFTVQYKHEMVTKSTTFSSQKPVLKYENLVSVFNWNLGIPLRKKRKEQIPLFLFFSLVCVFVEGWGGRGEGQTSN